MATAHRKEGSLAGRGRRDDRVLLCHRRDAFLKHWMEVVVKYTTLNKIRACSPCKDGWDKLLKHLGKTQADDEPLSFVTILDSNGLKDALWCCRAAPEYDREWRLFAVWCVLQVKHLLKDQRSLDALVVAEKYANGQAPAKELDAAEDAAWDAAWDAASAAARAAAGDAAGDAAWDAACDAAGDAAGDAAWDDAFDAAWAAAEDAQLECFRWVVDGGLTEFEKGRSTSVEIWRRL